MSEVVYYTEEGLEKLKADLDQLKSVERSECGATNCGSKR